MHTLKRRDKPGEPGYWGDLHAVPGVNAWARESPSLNHTIQDTTPWLRFSTRRLLMIKLNQEGPQ